MKIVESPALTRVLKVGATKDEQVDFLKEQIDELKQQKICYDGMIRIRLKAIKQIQKQQTIQNFMSRKSIMRGLLGSDQFKKKKPKKKKSKKKKAKRKRR